MSTTPRLDLPFLAVGQAQKEFTHNEALQTLDALVAGAVEGAPLPAPPVSPALGSCYMVAAEATECCAARCCGSPDSKSSERGPRRSRGRREVRWWTPKRAHRSMLFSTR